MKKSISPFAAFGMALSLLFLSCENVDEDKEAQLDLALKTPSKIISNTAAVRLFQNDQYNRLSTIGKQQTSFDDKAIHFNLEALSTYLNHIETMAVSKNIPITGASFIFGATDNGKRTLFLMPSIRNKELDYHESFIIDNHTIISFKHIETYAIKQTKSDIKNDLILTTNGYISYNEAADLFNNYQNQYITPFAKKVTKDYYTKAVWYSLEELKSYIYYLKDQSKSHALNITGIDVFYGVYNKDPKLIIKSNAQTVFLTAHFNTKSLINIHKETLKSHIEDTFYSKDNDEQESEESESLVYNEGQLSPPPPKKNN